MIRKRNAKGEGSFTANPDGSVTHRKSVGYKANGQRKVLTVTAATKTACIREMKKKEAHWNNEREFSRIQGKDTVVGLCHKHLQYQIENGDLKPKSIDRRECTIVNQIGKYELGKMQVHMVTPVNIDRHIRGLIKEGSVSASSIEKALDVLNAAYDWAVRKKELPENPVQPVRTELSKSLKRMSAKKAEDADVAVLSNDEIKTFVSGALNKNKDGMWHYSAGMYLVFLLYTGMRCGEMIALRWRDVDWERGLITIEKNASMAKNRAKQHPKEASYIMTEGTTKNQKARVIQLLPEARQILALIYTNSRFKEDDDLIAPTKSGRMNTATNLEHRMKVIMKNAGLEDIEGGLHIFRKTFATQMYEKGARVEEIAAYIGDLESTTRKYYIAIRKKMISNGEVRQIVRIPETSIEKKYSLQDSE